jgi:abhydrolase domain-containing protein 6
MEPPKDMRVGVPEPRAADLLVKAVQWYIRRRAGLARKAVQVDDHRWVFLQGGMGETILLVHGFGSEKHQWGFFPKAFSSSYELIIPDLPGFGEGTRIDSAAYDIESQVRRLDRFVDILDLKAFHLLGISMGGYIAGYYACEYPKKVKSLALMSAAGVRSSVESAAWKKYRETGEIVLLYQSEPEFDRLLSALFYKPPPVPGFVKRYLTEKGRIHYPFYRKVLRDIEKQGVDLLEGRLWKVEAKCLIIWGAEDQIIHVSAVEKFEKELEQSKSVILQECGHVPYLEQRRKTVQAYKNFLASLAQG